jgi:hypothetical protein
MDESNSSEKTGKKFSYKEIEPKGNYNTVREMKIKREIELSWSNLTITTKKNILF